MEEPETQTSQKTSRSVFITLLLSVFTPGLGHVYNGRLVTGISIIAASLLYMVFIEAIGFISSFTNWVISQLLFFIGWLFVVLHAISLAKRNRHYTLKGFNKPIVYVGILVLGSIASYLLDVYQEKYLLYNHGFSIATPSMHPTLQVKDRVNARMNYFNRHPVTRGALVMFTAPAIGEGMFISRVVGLPGDTIEIRNQKLLVNGQKQSAEIAGHGKDGEYDLTIYRSTINNRPYKFSVYTQPLTPERVNLEKLVVEENHYFILADNRDNGLDSRDLGTISKEQINGKPLFLYWSDDKSRIGNELD